MRLGDLLLTGFTTGGTIHIILNNQLGFTTTPAEGRSCPHPSDIGKTVGAPILHVNADDPDAVVQACLIASDWRDRYKQDIVIDIIGYRRSGLTQYLHEGLRSAHVSESLVALMSLRWCMLE